MAAKLAPLANNLITAAKPKLRTFVRYARVEMTPPTPAELPQVFSGLGRFIKGATTFSWTRLPVKEVWINTLVGTEVLCWFFVGECIGKRSIFAYKVCDGDR